MTTLIIILGIILIPFVLALFGPKGAMVTGGCEGNIPYSMNSTKLFMNFGESMDRDFGEGLAALKTQCEN